MKVEIISKKVTAFFISLLTLFGCQSCINETPKEYTDLSFYVGTYTNGKSQGIYKYTLLQNGTLKKVGLAAKSNNPSFLAFSENRDFLVAVNEINENDDGTVESFSIEGDSLILISRSTSGGAHPCFVSTNKDGFVLTANYTGGSVGLLHLNETGHLSQVLDVQQHVGHGTNERQEAPHAHSAWFSPGDNTVIAVDLGTNQLWFSHLDTTLKKLHPTNPTTLHMHPGAGPRHLAFHPNQKWIYVANELNSTVALVEKTDQNTYRINSTMSTLPDGYEEPNTCADIKITSDGKYLYVSNRGHNSLAIFEISANDGTLSLLGHESTKGDGPRNFSLSRDNDYLLVANQYSNNIVSFKRDSSNGLLKYIHQVEAPTPVCIVF